jgi:hypothetical protein
MLIFLQIIFISKLDNITHIYSYLSFNFKVICKIAKVPIKIVTFSYIFLQIIDIYENLSL